MLRNLIILGTAFALLGACTYEHKPKDGVKAAIMKTQGKLIGKVAENASEYSLTVSGLNGATFSMIPAQINSDFPTEVPFNPGVNKARIFLTWPKTHSGKHLDVPFKAKPGETYHFTYGIQADGKHAATLLDSHGNVANKVTFTLVPTTTYTPYTIKVPR